MSIARKYDWLTFDRYGTLIHWETGIQTALKRALSGEAMGRLLESRIFQLYEEREKRVELEAPFRTYSEILQ